MKEDTFKILKDDEAFCIGHIIQQEDDLGFDELFKEVSTSFKALCDEHNVSLDDMTKDLLLLNIPFSKDYVHFLIELTGIVKLFGYPNLNVERGLQAIRLNACKNVQIDYRCKICI